MASENQTPIDPPPPPPPLTDQLHVIASHNTVCGGSTSFVSSQARRPFHIKS